jgi:trimeric autotransporter adhesin
MKRAAYVCVCFSVSIALFLRVSPLESQSRRVDDKKVDTPPARSPEQTTGPLNDFLRRGLASSPSKASTPTTPVVSVGGLSVSGSASFVYNGGAAPQAQTITVSSSAGAISFGTTVTSGGWLSVNPGSGTTPATLSVSANPTGLANGTYGGSIAVFGLSSATTATVSVSSVSASLVVNVSSQQTLTLSASSIPPALAGVVYSATLGVTGGTPPYKWSGSGSLPGGMSLSSGGVLSGTPSQAGAYSFTVTVQDSSTPPLTASGSFNLIVTQPSTLLSVSAQQLSFSYVQGDSNTPAPQSFGVLSNPSGTAVAATSATSDGGSWLIVSPNFGPQGQTPGTITVSVDTTKVVGPNTYTGEINISAPEASPSNASVYVTFQVGAAQPPQLSVTPPQSFALPQAGQSQGTVGVSNIGGGTLNYTSAATSDFNWLTIAGGSQGNVTPSTPASVGFTVNAANVPPGLHSGRIAVTDLGGTSASNPQISNVALLVNGTQPTIQLSQAGLTFYSVQNTNVVPPSQSVAIFNLGSQTFSWSTQPIQYAGTTQGWLTVTASGSSDPGSPGQATVWVNPAGLAEGQYYATVNVTSAGAANSPQSFTVLLNVVGQGQLGSSPQVSTSGTILAAPAGSTAAVTQTITMVSPAGLSPSYSTNVFTSGGGNWLSVTPAAGSLGVSGIAPLTIQASAAGVATGVFYGTVQIAFGDGTIQTIQVALVATSGASTSGADARLRSNAVGRPDASGGCTPKTLVATFTSPGENAQLQVEQAQTFQVQISDDCGNPLLTSENPTVELVNASTSPNALLATLTSTPTSNGLWTGSWTPSMQGAVQVRVYASRGLTFGGISTPPPPQSVVDVTVLPANADAAAQPAGVINGASFDTSIQGLVVPGGYVSIYGQRMADDTAQATGGSLAPTLGNAQLLLGGQPLPLLFVNSGQVNGLIPQNLALNSSIQLQVVRDNTQSVPVPALVTDLQPGIFTTAQTGQGQGSILIAGTGTVAGPGPGPAQQPVSPGQYLEIYATGLGQVMGTGGAAPPGDGQPAPASGSPLYTTAATATVTIGGVSAPVAFAGLAPGFVALYQVNVQVPASVQAGSAVPVVLTMTDGSGYSASSQMVTIAVSAPAVESAADHSGGRVAPGEIVVLHPPNAGPEDLLGFQLDGDGKVATVLADTRVWFDGFPAPLAYAVSGNVMAVVPYEISNQSTTKVVVEYQGKLAPPVTLDVVPSTPALFTLDSTGKGQAAMLNETGCCNSRHDPAARGSIGVLYATGEGQTTPPGITGSVSFHDRIADYPSPQLPVHVTVGGQEAEIVYAGDAPNAVAGLIQVNFRVPANAPIGDAVPLVLSIGDSRSPDGVTMAIRSAVKRILVVDPDPAARNWFKKVLVGASYDVSTARNGVDAVNQAKLHPTDLVIFSLAIPEKERMDSIRAIRAAWSQVSVAATTPGSVLDPATLRGADLLGAQTIFTHPLDSQSVLRRVRELLRSHPTPYTTDEQRTPPLSLRAGVQR